MYKSSSLYFLETSFLLIYDKDRLDKVDLGRVGLLFVDLFWLKTFIQKLVIWKNIMESFIVVEFKFI